MLISCMMKMSSVFCSIPQQCSNAQCLLTDAGLPSQDVASDMYSRFSEDGNMVVWESLIICARPSHMESPCPICYEGFSSYVPFLTSCKHAFHEGCLAAWHKHKAPATCHMCRGDLLAMVDSLSI